MRCLQEVWHASSASETGVQAPVCASVSEAVAAYQGRQYGAGDARRYPLLAIVRCTHPVQAYQLVSGAISFVERGDVQRSLQLRCGQCIHCRLDRSRMWATRCMHEASLYPVNSFVTLTYDKAHLPPGGSLRYPDFQAFMKRARARFSRTRVRFYMCGEYGEQFARPHYHACLFNLDFPDKLPLPRSPSGSEVYRSGVLEDLWPHGFSSIGRVTFESAAYVARYCVAKVTGDAAAAHYRVVDPETGEVFNRVPEFNHMSLKPGIGSRWLQRFYRDVYPSGTVTFRGGVKSRAPRFYDNWYKGIVDPDTLRPGDWHEQMLYARHLEALAHSDDNTDERLRVQELVTRGRLSQLKRGL